MMTRIIVIGGGVAGLSAVREIAHRRSPSDGISLTLVNRHRWNLFSPLLPDLISGRIEPDHLAYPLERFCRGLGVEFVHDEVVDISLRDRKILLRSGELQADMLLLCPGCWTNYHGNSEFEAHAPGLKDLHEAVEIRHRARALLTDMRSHPDRVGHLLIIGAGYTGFELASHLALYVYSCMAQSQPELRERIRIVMAEYAPTVLPTTTPGVQAWARHYIERYGVSIRTNTTVESFEQDGSVRLTSGEVLDNTEAFWTAGVGPRGIFATLDVPRTRGNRVAVDEYLRVPGYDGVFGAGDIAGSVRPGESEPLRMGVQFSRAGGQRSGENMLRALRGQKLRKFDPYDPGYVIPLGPGHALGVLMGREVHGHMPFVLHYLMSILRSRGWENRAAVTVDLFREIWSRPNRLRRQDGIDRIHEEFRQRPLADA